MPNSPHVTEQLIVRARAGEKTALSELLGQLGPDLRREIEREVESFKSRSDANHIWDDTLSQAWQQFSDFEGSSVTELHDWLRKAVLNLLRSTTKTEADNLETIAPGSNRDQQTIVSAPTTGERSIKPEVPSTNVQESGVAPTSPLPVTTRDANRATISNRPPQSDAGAFDAPESDPLATIVANDDTSSGGDPLATIATKTPAEPSRQPATKTFGDYEILETIARGGMGVVYRARHRKLNRVVALKMILTGQFANPEDVERFHAEAEAAARLSHPNIVGIHDVGQFEGQHFISMQFVEGQSLADLVRDHPLQPRAASNYMAAISEAMQYAHDHGILHRDLKPANVLVDGSGMPLVTDFGLAKLNPNDALGDEQARAGHSQITMDGTVMGTASYMPPEQAIGKLDEISERSDVYSLGATLYHLLTGKPPFGAANVHETIRQVIEAEPVAPRVLNANVPKDLETICLKCLQKLPARRYASAQELADELRRYRAGQPIHARPVGFVERTIRWCYRNPWPTTAICASLCGLIVATVLWRTAVSARIAATDAKIVAQTKQKEADESRAHLLAAIDELFTRWGNVTLLNEPAFAGVRSQLLVAATKMYADISKHLHDDLELQQKLGVSYYLLGNMMFRMEGYREADEAIQSALEIQGRGDVDVVTDKKQLQNLGDTLTMGGSIKVRLAVAGQSLDSLDDAVGLYKRAIHVRSRLVQLVPDELEFQRQLLVSRMNLVNVEQRKGDPHATRCDELMGQSWESEEKRDLAEAARLATLADFEIGQADKFYRAARTQLDIVQRERKQLLARVPEDSRVRNELIHDLALGSFNLANITIWLDDFDLAEQYIRNASNDFELLLADDSDSLQNQFDLARCQQLAGDIFQERIRSLPEPEPGQPESDESAAVKQQHYGEALQHYANTTHILEMLDSSSPAIVTRYRVALGILLPRIGDLHFVLENDEEARGSYEKAISILQPLVDAHPESLQISDLLGQALGGLELLESFEVGEPESKTPAPSSTELDDSSVPEKQAAD